MNSRQKSWITRMEKIMLGMDKHERAMEITAYALKLYQNMKWTTWEIVEVEEFLLKVSKP